MYSFGKILEEMLGEKLIVVSKKKACDLSILFQHQFKTDINPFILENPEERGSIKDLIKFTGKMLKEIFTENQ